MLLGNLHTNLGDGVGDLKIRPRGDNLRESAKRTGLQYMKDTSDILTARRSSRVAMQPFFFIS